MALINRTFVPSILSLVACWCFSFPVASEEAATVGVEQQALSVGEAEQEADSSGKVEPQTQMPAPSTPKPVTIEAYRNQLVDIRLLESKTANCAQHTFTNYEKNKANMSLDARAEELDKIERCNEIEAEIGRLSAPLNRQDLAMFQLMTTPEEDKEDIENERQNIQSSINFLGLSWGLGFGFSWSEDDAVDEASIVNGIVRASSNKKEQPRLVLEFHRFLPWVCNKERKLGDFGCGPFVAVAAKSDDLLGGVGMGWMWGFKSKPGDSAGFSIGVGAILDGDVKDLADGFKDGQPAPDGETEIRYIEESRWSGLLFVTRTF